MIRAQLGDQAYWDKWVDHSEKRTVRMLKSLEEISLNPAYDPQYSLDAAFEHLRLLLERYSRGDPIPELAQYMAGLLDAWELSNSLSNEICVKHNLTTCRDWIFDLTDLNHYNWCFWLVGLGVALEIPESQWNRLVTLVGGEGQDVLLDRIIASRHSARRVSKQLLHPKPYQHLLRTVDAPKAQQASLLLNFVDHWYPGLARKGKDELWWYSYGNPDTHPLEKGSYFGRWCIEAVAAVKAFNLDDSLCLGHENYPGDLLRPVGPSTHRQIKFGLWARMFGGK